VDHRLGLRRHGPHGGDLRAAAAVRESSVGAAGGGAFVGLILGALFCTFVRLVTLPLEREVEALRDRVAELERRGGPGPTGPAPGG
jgi:hypothetical protein